MNEATILPFKPKKVPVPPSDNSQLVVGEVTPIEDRQVAMPSAHYGESKLFMNSVDTDYTGIKAYYLVTGEYVIARGVRKGDMITLSKPMRLMPNPEQPGAVVLVPFLPQFVMENDFNVHVSMVLAPLTPIPPLENAYRQGTSGLVTAPASVMDRLPKIVPDAD